MNVLSLHVLFLTLEIRETYNIIKIINTWLAFTEIIGTYSHHVYLALFIELNPRRTYMYQYVNVQHSLTTSYAIGEFVYTLHHFCLTNIPFQHYVWINKYYYTIPPEVHQYVCEHNIQHMAGRYNTCRTSVGDRYLN